MTRQESVVRYERLRDAQLRGGRPSRERELFIQGGMLSWLYAWRHYAPLPKTAGHGVEQMPDAAVAVMSVPLNGAVAEVLASMTWAAFSQGGQEICQRCTTAK